jgi:hypothetical protein
LILLTFSRELTRWDARDWPHTALSAFARRPSFHLNAKASKISEELANPF